jgi:hypothetical protein
MPVYLSIQSPKNPPAWPPGRLPACPPARLLLHLRIRVFFSFCFERNRNSSVTVVTWVSAGRVKNLEFKSWHDKLCFLQTIHSSCGVAPASYPVVTKASYHKDEAARLVKLTAHLYLGPTLRFSSSVPPVLHMFSRRGA